MESNEFIYAELDVVVPDEEEQKSTEGDEKIRSVGTIFRRIDGRSKMTDVPGDNRIANASQLRKHPVYKGETSRDKREFIGKYQE
uniref:AlNc14C28G2695 protein n=1 Tax=Albugo laibachii Nc14 TaxID=890382 RepID=F0W767_9STRA|nr:AlNc14C28G2695 [Albugo laibachii Nc14]|eukprot:CCA16966.1 AlNc14C28G2695 [Albugo laibachii Nc14]